MNNNKLLWLVLHTMTGLIFLGLVYLLFFEESLFEHMANYLCLSLCLAIIQLLFLYVLGVLAIKKLKPETRRQRLQRTFLWYGCASLPFGMKTIFSI